jgi:NitT/TauT family transport system substrate-binding protein/putative hydroxymethylpyrimidine transport system substrate-binding protein
MRRATLIAACLLALAGCGEKTEHLGQPERLRLALDFTPNAAHAPIYAAARTGADRRHGVRVEILPPGSGTPDSLKLVASGRADVGVLDIHDLGLAAERGADVVGIAPLVQKPLAAVIARGTVRRPRDLEGRRVGVTGLPSDIAVLRAVVEGDHGNFARVKRTTIGFSAVPQMVAGKVDAVTAFWNAEGVVLRDRGVRVRDFRVDDYGAPPYPEVVLFAKRSTVERKRAQLRALVAALSDGVRAVRSDRTAAIREVARASSADESLVDGQLRAVDPLFDPPMRFDRAVLDRWADWDAMVGILKSKPDPSRLFAFNLMG